MSFSEIPRRGSRGFDPGFGASEFPSGTGGQGTRIDRGPNSSPGPRRTTEFFYRCQQCGFPLLAKRQPSPGGNPNGDAGVTKTDLGGDVIDPVNRAGSCHLCATLNSRKGGT